MSRANSKGYHSVSRVLLTCYTEQTRSEAIGSSRDPVLLPPRSSVADVQVRVQAQHTWILLRSKTCLKSHLQPPFLGPVGVATPPFRSRSSLSFSFRLSPSRIFFTRPKESCLSFPALQSSGLYGEEMMTWSWTMISWLCQRTGRLL